MEARSSFQNSSAQSVGHDPLICLIAVDRHLRGYVTTMATQDFAAPFEEFRSFFYQCLYQAARTGQIACFTAQGRFPKNSVIDKYYDREKNYKEVDLPVFYRKSDLIAFLSQCPEAHRSSLDMMDLEHNLTALIVDVFINDIEQAQDFAPYMEAYHICRTKPEQLPPLDINELKPNWRAPTIPDQFKRFPEIRYERGE